jgi:hypothetical protein
MGVTMASMPVARRNPFGPIDSAAVLAALKAAGSYDPDVVHAAKARLLAPYRDLRRLSIVGVALSCVLTVLSMPVFAAFALIGSALLWRFQAKQVANVESGYAEYVGSAKT